MLPVCLNWNPSIVLPNPQYGQTLVIGWGKTSNIGRLQLNGAYSSKLRKAQVPIVGLAICRHEFLNQFNVWGDKHLCAGDEGIV